MNHMFCLKCKLLAFATSLLVSIPGMAQLQSINQMKTVSGAEAEQKALEVSPEGDTFYGINAVSVSLLNRDASYSEVIHPEGSTNRAATLVKVNADGTWAWGKQAYGSPVKNSQITGISYSSNGYLYITGGVTSNSNVESPVNIFGLTASSKGYMDYFVTKVDPATGVPVWATTMGSAADWDLPNGIVVDGNGNSYMFHMDFTTSFKLKTEDGLEETMTVTGGSGNDNLVVKVDNNGFPVWGKTIGTIYKEKAGSIALDKNGNVLLATVLNSSSATAADKDLTNDPIESRIFTIGNNSYELAAEKATELLITNLSKVDGSVLWSYLWGGPGNQLVTKIAATADNGCVILGSNNGKNVLLCISSSGNKVWEVEVANGAAMKGLATDAEGGIFVSGNFSAKVTLGSIQLTPTANQDAFIAKFDKNGNFEYVGQTSGTGGEAINHIAVNGSYLGFAGVRTGDVKMPFTGDAGLTPRTTNGANHDFISGSYRLNPGFVGGTELIGKKFVSLTYQIGVAFIPSPEFSIVGGSLPKGLTLDVTTGIISGRPEVEESGSFTINASSSTVFGLSFDQVYTYTIERKPCDVLSVSPASLEGPYKTGVFIPQTFVLENGDGTITWSAENLPQGLSINGSTGVLSGNLMRSGTYTFMVTGTDESGCSASRSYTINVEAYNYLSAPSLSWITGVQGKSFDHGKGNAIDKDGNVFVSSTYSALAFNERISFPETGTPEAMMAKINGLSGEPIWAKRIGGEGTGNEQGQSVATDPTTGDVVWTGIMTANALIGDMEQSAPIVTNGGRDIFLARYNTSGSLIWAKPIGTSADWEAGLNVLFDRKGNIYMIGYKNNKPLEVEAADGGKLTLGDNTSSIVFVKFNGAGKALWGKNILTSTEIYGLVTDAQNNIYTAGIISGSVDFGDGKTVEANGKATFVAKYTEDGVCSWVSLIGQNGDVLSGRGNDLAIDSKGNLYVATYSKGKTEFGESTVTAVGGTDMVVYKLGPNGEKQSYYQAGSSKDDGGITVCLDKNDNLYVSGYYAGTVEFGNGVSMLLTPGTTISTFVAKYNASGDFVWSLPLGNNVSSGIMSTALALSVDRSSDDVIVSGYTNNNKVYAYAYSGKRDYADGAYFIARYSQKMGAFGILPDGELNVAYKGTIRATGCQNPENLSYTITQGALPLGLTLNSETGDITGTPSAGGKREFTVKVSDGVTDVSKKFSIEIVGASDCELSIDPIMSVPSCVNGQSFSMNVYASLGTGDVTWSFDDVNAVPKGLSITTKDSETGVLSGIPNSPAGTYTFTLIATDEAGCFATVSISLTVTGQHTSINDIKDAAQNVLIYPSLVTEGRLFLSLKDKGEEMLTLTVSDVKGVRFSQEHVSLGYAQEYPIATDHLPDGMYFLTVYSKEKYIGTFRFIVKN